MNVAVRGLSRSDRVAAVALLGRAFERDPLFVAAFGDSRGDSDRRRALRRFISWLLAANRLAGGCRLAAVDEGRLVGVAIVEVPRGRAGRTLGLAAAAVRFLPVALTVGAATTFMLNRYGVRTRSLVPARPHHYLTMVGVLPEAQGRGVGRALVEHVVQMSERDHRSAGVWLDTENEENLEFYTRRGFGQGGVITEALFTVHVLYRPREAFR